MHSIIRSAPISFHFRLAGSRSAVSADGLAIDYQVSYLQQKRHRQSDRVLSHTSACKRGSLHPAKSLIPTTSDIRKVLCHCTENHTTDTAKSIDTNFNSHCYAPLIFSLLITLSTGHPKRPCNDCWIQVDTSSIALTTLSTVKPNSSNSWPAGGRLTEAVHTNHLAVQADILVPAIRKLLLQQLPGQSRRQEKRTLCRHHPVHQKQRCFGMDTTRTFLSEAAAAFTARSTSEPVAITMASGVPSQSTST